MDKICALLLAAGKGTRMHSAKPKVLQTLLGEPILGLLVDKIHELMGADIYAVVGYGAEQIALSYPKLKLIKQEEQLGTAHAVQTALPTLKAQGYEQVLVINGDTPLVTKELLETFLTKAKGYDLALATLELKDPQSFGRIIRQNGEIKAIVEAKDYQKEIYGEPSGEINAGLYSFKMDLLETLLPKVTPSRQTGEYYLTDL
ncbi:MAG: NTP transferase domain-containing protein, partial [Desulfovibrionaceae bacterium]|nr:NTP transferase domain-containing protein [Desulfovibrionaceae bacterium]